MKVCNKYRQYQFVYVFVDLLSSLLVWTAFLGFRWLVYEGKVLSVDTVFIPMFNFYLPLILYPLGCFAVYYLSGYYLRPFRKRYLKDLSDTLLSSAVIALGAFFVIIIDDVVDSYQRYTISLLVLFALQFALSYLPRLCVTFLFRHFSSSWPQVYTIHSLEQADVLLQKHLSESLDEVVIDLPDDACESDIYSIINRLYPLGVQIAVRPRLYDMLTGAASIMDVEDVPLVHITEHKMTDMQLCVKRAFDVLVSAIFLVLFSPLYVFLYVLVWCSSRGPAIYRQERIGLHGVPFQIFKFRTMRINAENSIPMLSADHDPRVTLIGRFLRKYRLDELPQMWNVLKGDMSIVGPRPERRYFIQQIEQQAPYYCLLYKIRPGLTSWGPIKVGYTDTIDKMVRRLNYDIVYMENMSLKLDLKIIFHTISVILDGKGK